MSKVKALLSRVFKRGHPDIYQAAKAYAEKQGINVSDVVSAAVTGYLASDAEGKEELEQVMTARRTSGGSKSGSMNMKPLLDTFTQVCEAMGTMFSTMTNARSQMQADSLISDYKATVKTAEEIKKLGGEGGSGSLEDLIGEIFLRKILGGELKMPKRTKRKTGSAPVETIGED